MPSSGLILCSEREDTGIGLAHDLHQVDGFAFRHGAIKFAHGVDRHLRGLRPGGQPAHAIGHGKRAGRFITKIALSSFCRRTLPMSLKAAVRRCIGNRIALNQMGFKRKAEIAPRARVASEDFPSAAWSRLSRNRRAV